MLRTIRFKMLVLIAICLGLGTIQLTWYLNRRHEASISRMTGEAIQGAAAAFRDVERTSAELMGASIDALARDPEVRATLAARDPARALALSQPLFRDYRARYGITHWNYWEPEPPGEMAPKGLRNIVRVGTPDMHGDFVERTTLARVAGEHRQVKGLDLGYTGLVLRVLAPVEEEGKAVGYIELGKELGTFLQDVKRITGNEFGALVAKARMDEKKWSAHRSAAGTRNNWEDMPDLLLVENTSAGSDLLRYGGRLEEVPEEGKALEIVRRGGRVLARGVFPIRNVAGDRIGAVFVLRDVTAAHAALRGEERQAILAVVGIMAVLAALLMIAFHVLVVRRLQRMIRVATRVVGGEFDLEIVPSAHDELGELETLFEQFRMLFVELIGQAQQSTGTSGPHGR